jgi:phosphoribosylformylglycinamidine synthase
MTNINLSEIKNVRIGKHISLEIEAQTKEIASKKVNEACEKMLCNQIMESFEFKLEKI